MTLGSSIFFCVTQLYTTEMIMIFIGTFVFMYNKYLDHVELYNMLTFKNIDPLTININK